MTDTTPQPYYRDDQVTLILGDALEQLRTLPDGSVDCIVTSGWHGPAGPSAQEAVPSLASHPNGANPGDVWDLPTATFAGAHFAVMPPELARRCIKAGCRPGGTVLDPFSGSGTTGDAARDLGRKYIGIDLKPAYHDLAKERFAQGVLDLDLPA